MTIILLVTIPMSVKAITWGMVIAAACEMMFNTAASLRYTTLSVIRLLRTLTPIALLTAAMLVATEMVGYLAMDCGILTRLILKITIGVIVYIGGSRISRMEAFDETFTIARQLLNKVLKKD